MNSNRIVKDYIFIVVGAFILGFAIKNVFDPIGLVTGGVSGIAIILKDLFEIPLWISNTVLNIPLFLVAVKLKGWEFIKRTFVSAMMLSISLYALPEMIFLPNNIFLASLYGGIIAGIGIGLVLMANATTGGTDLLSALIQRAMPHYSIASILQVVDASVVVAGASIFGIEYALYAMISIYVVTKVSDGMIEGLKFSKVAYIISEHNDEIAKKIMETMERGVTGLDARGMYSGNRKEVLFCVVSKKEIVQLKELVVSHDSQAFIIVSDAREVLGEGFIEFRQ